MRRRLMSLVSVAAALVLLVAVMTPQPAAAAVPGETYTYTLGSGDTFFWKYTLNYGTKTFAYTYTNMEQGYVDATGETLNLHENVGQYYRDNYLYVIEWGPVYQGGRYWSNGTQVASITSRVIPKS
ncbi:MAG: hypothetical protein M1602_05355 [Firmicutes bacterium]|nr:hypothetical protein [Bacillota bacterium]